ncbi:MAG TPA: M20 family metallo-hydrolase [Bryobacteraceae bacterium]|jgi:N-carbamoyl-L-amino-acid hydrolase|nr:M20 family metallo-hydrolase [Bryobacteraceae bacterium]
MQVEINSGRLESELEQLASFSDTPAPAVTRIVFGEADLRARAWLKERCLAAGLQVREDAVGNAFARWSCNHAGRPAIGTGSHIDAIPNAGRYDGTVGVLGGLEAIRSLQKTGFVPKRPIELLLFTSEEPTRFGIGCLGSRLLSGVLDAQKASALRDQTGCSLDQLRQAAGFSGPLSSVRFPAGSYAAFIELHIEQGPLLEQAGIAVGLVTGIAAPASMRIVVQGEGGHAGAVLMPNRRDALTAAAEIVLSVERLALATGALDTVATTGACDVFPGAINSIPSRVSLGLDMRDTDLARRDALVHAIHEAAAATASKRRLSLELELLNADQPARCDPQILDALRQSCAEENVTCMDMVSRAYHDSLFLSRIAPTAMLFIPCRGGVSHRPDEFASMPDIANGVRVLARALARLAQ